MRIFAIAAAEAIFDSESRWAYEDYEANKGALIEGYQMAREFLLSQSVFRMHDLPYTTQLIPLAAICAVIGWSTFNLPETQNILSRWFWCGIMGEMYFRAKKQVFDFENFRVRSLAAINALNFFISTAMTFLTEMQRQQKHGLLAVILEAADPIKQKVHLFHYRIELGIRSILFHAKCGVKDWFKTLQPNRNQLRLRLVC